MEALESRTLPEMLWERARRGGGEVAFRVKDASGAFAPRTWDWVAGEVRRLSRALAAAGVQPQDRVGLLAPSTIEWILAEWAIVAAGAVSVPLFAVLSPGETAGYLSDVGARWVLVDAPERAETLSAIYREKGATPPRWMTLEALFSAKDAGGGQVPPAGDPDLPATIACTSGTTGRPKGVLLTHANYLALLRALPSAGILDDSLRESGILLFLPFPHSFARLILLASCMFGVPVALSDPRTLRDDAKLLQPGLIPSVPLVFQRLREGTLSALRAAPLPRRLMGSAALAVGGMAARQRQRKGTVSAWLAPFHRAADRMVLGKIRAALGLSRAHALLSGSTAAPQPVIDFFAALGLHLVEGYGATETSGAVTCNPVGQARAGTVGKPLEGVDIRLAEDGEILVRGACIAGSYADARPIRGEQGWFPTGDVGHLDERGYLVLTGRKVDLIKTGGGHRLIPYPIEARLEEHPAIGTAVLFGEARPFVVALLFLREGVQDSEEVRRQIADQVSKVSGDAAPHARIRRHAVLADRMDVQSGLMTASLKVRRSFVQARYAALLEDLYKNGPA